MVMMVMMDPDWPFGHLHVFGYDLIVVDPPWDVSDAGAEFQHHPPRHPMSFDEIAKLPVGHLARRDCLILTWGSSPLIHKQIAVVERWGAVYRSKIDWHWHMSVMKIPRGSKKPRVLNSTECVLVATIGDPKHLPLPGAMHHGWRKYPSKPTEFYKMLDVFCPNLRFRADVFTMKGDKDWDRWRPRYEKPGPEAAAPDDGYLVVI